MKIINVSLWSQHVLNTRLIARLNETLLMVPEENATMEEKPFPCYPRNCIMEIPPSEWINRRLKKNHCPANKYIHSVSQIRLILTLHLLSSKEKDLARGKQVDERRALKLGSRRIHTCPRELKFVGLPGYSSLLTGHFPQAQTRPIFVANPTVIKVADMLVTIDEKTKKVNCAVCWVSFLFAVKWHLTISPFHSTFRSHFWESPAVLRWPLGWIPSYCLQLRDIWEQLSKPCNLDTFRSTFLHLSLTWKGAEGMVTIWNDRQAAQGCANLQRKCHL